MLKKALAMMALSLLMGFFSAQGSFLAHADDDAEMSADEESGAKQPHWDAKLKEKYGLTDEKIAEMKKAGLNGPAIARVAHLSQLSGKSTDEVLKMRTERKMGWGKIAKELGVHPSELGRAVSSMRKEVRGDRVETRKERREKRREHRKEKREKRGEKRGKS